MNTEIQIDVELTVEQQVVDEISVVVLVVAGQL
jgi:hypothetical protein